MKPQFWGTPYLERITSGCPFISDLLGWSKTKSYSPSQALEVRWSKYSNPSIRATCILQWLAVSIFFVFEYFFDLHPIPISKIAPGRNWRTAWWSLTPPDPSPGHWSLWIRASKIQRWSPVVTAGHRSCSVMKPFLSTSNSAKSAATWPGTQVDFSRNSSQLQGISWQFQRPRNAFPKCHLLRQWILHGSRTHLSARVRPGKLGGFFLIKSLGAPKWDGLPSGKRLQKAIENGHL